MNNIGKRLMPIYLEKFLEENYFDIIPENFGRRMVSRQFIAEIKALYDEFDGKPIDNYGRRMVPEYLIKAFSDIEYIEYTDDDVKYEKTVPTGALKYATLDMLGGMTYTVLNEETSEYELKDSAVTSVVAKKTYEIDEHIQALTGYGVGLPSYTNTLNLNNGKFTQNSHKLVIDSNTQYSYVAGNFKSATIGLIAPYKAPTTSFNKIWVNNDNISNITYEQNGGLFITFTTAYESAQDLKDSLIGVEIVYQLATPVETDVSDYIKGNFIEVEPNGSVTFINEYEQAVPSEVTYLIKE